MWNLRSFLIFVILFIVCLFSGLYAILYKSHTNLDETTTELLFDKTNLLDKLKTLSSENETLRNQETSKNQISETELKITNYILTNYKKVPPVLAKVIAKVTLEKAAKYNISFHVIVAVMEVESNFNPFSVSKLKNDPARGLMQVRYNVWKEVLDLKSVYDLHSITGGIDAGTRVLRHYLDETKDLDKTLYKYVGKDKTYVRLVYAKMGKFTVSVN